MADAAARDAVWLDVLPSMKNFGSELAKGAEKDADKVGKSTGRKFGTAMLAGVAVVAGGAALATKALYGIGETFDEVSDTIRVGTGATGEALDGLVESAKRVGTQVPAEFEAIGTMVADVNTRLGLTGETLETFASQALEAGRIMGEEIDINAVSSAFNAFNVQGEDTIDAMDHLYRVSQATGIGMNELATNAATSAPALQALGFSFEETTALVGNLDKAGLNSSKMMAGMSRALVELAKDGEEPAEAFERTTGEIQAFLDQGDKAAAVDLASQLFGTRNASQFIGALESGALAMEDLGAVAGMTEDTILGAGRETMDFAEQWQIFKNQVLIALEPIATRVFNVLGKGMEWINSTGIPYVKGLWESFQSGEGTLGGVRDIFDRVWSTVRALFDYVVATAVPALKGFIEEFRNGEGAGGRLRDVFDRIYGAVMTAFGWIRDEGIPALQALADFVLKTLWPDLKTAFLDGILPAFQAVADTIMVAWEKVIFPALSALWKFVRDVLAPFLADFYENGIKPTFKLIGDAISFAWSNVIKPAFEALVTGAGDVWGAVVTAKDWIVGAWDTVSGAISSGWDKIKGIFDKFKGGLDSLREKFSSVKDGITQIWGTIGGAIARPINKVIDAVNGFTKGLADNLSKIPGVSISIPTIPHVPVPSVPRNNHGKGGASTGGHFADGGMIPGWSPHDRADNIPAWLTAGEYVLPVAATRRLRQRFGGGFLEQLRQGLPGYADGGLVGARGGSLGDALLDGGRFLWDLFRKPLSTLKGFADRAFGSLADSLPVQIAKGVAGDAISKLVTWVKDNLFGGEDGVPPRAVGAPMAFPMIAALVKALVPNATITSTLRPGARTAGYGTTSLHALGRAVDFVSPNMVAATKLLSQLQGWTELIHTPAGRWQQAGGRSFTNFAPITKQMHYDHVHVGMADGGLVRPFVADSGALLAPGINVLDNRTGGPEPLGRLDQPLDLSGDTISDLRREFKGLLDANRKALLRELVTVGRAG